MMKVLWCAVVAALFLCLGSAEARPSRHLALGQASISSSNGVLTLTVTGLSANTSYGSSWSYSNGLRGSTNSFTSDSTGTARFYLGTSWFQGSGTLSWWATAPCACYTTNALSNVATIALPVTTTTDVPYWTESFSNGACSIASRWTYEPSPCDTNLFRTVTGTSGNGIGLHTTPTSYGPNGNSQMTSVWTSDAHQSYGTTVWYATKMNLPSCCYSPTPGGWNWLVEWHDDNYTQSLGANSEAFGVFYYTGDTPHLVLRIAYGQATNPTYDETSCRMSSTVQYDHWYDLKFRYTWSEQASTGHVTFIVDGATVCDLSVPTLYVLPDGSHSTINSFGLYNYHVHANYDMESRFDEVKVGPTLSSVS